MCRCIVWRERKHLSQHGLGCGKTLPSVFIKKGGSESDVDIRPAKHCLKAVWVNVQSSVKKVARYRSVFLGGPLVYPSLSLETQFDGSRIEDPLRSFRLGENQFGTQFVGEPRDNFVLHVEEIGYRLVEA